MKRGAAKNNMKFQLSAVEEETRKRVAKLAKSMFPKYAGHAKHLDERVEEGVLEN